MPYLTYVGPDTYRDGFASRGYWAFRRGRTVITRFGAIVVERHRGNKVRWAYGWSERPIKCRSESEAVSRLQQIVKEKMYKPHAYILMPKGRRIE